MQPDSVEMASGYVNEQVVVLLIESGVSVETIESKPDFMVVVGC